MTLPESTVAKVREALRAADDREDSPSKMSEWLRTLAAEVRRLTPPPAMGGLPDGLEGVRVMFGAHKLAEWMKSKSGPGHLHAYDAECPGSGCTPIEIHPQGTRSSMEGLRYFVNNPSAWDHFSQNVSDQIAAILRDGKESK